MFRSGTDSQYEALKRAYQTNAFRTHIACLTTYGISLKVSHQISILDRTTVKHPFNAMLSTTAENNKEDGPNVGVAALSPPPTEIHLRAALGAQQAPKPRSVASLTDDADLDIMDNGTLGKVLL